ncbi:MAG: zeta toxin family protein [Bdellovibrionales bacterium]
MGKPKLYMIAGPNGAGKTTAALKLLPDFLSIYDFVNADNIALGIDPLKPESQALFAARIMLDRMDHLISGRQSFAFETTGASVSFARKIEQAKKLGYEVGLLFLWLPSVDLAKARVKQRVQQGGHHIPEPDIARRFERGLRNLIRIYLPLTDEASIIDATRPLKGTARIIAEKSNGTVRILNAAIWRDMNDQATKGN